LKVYADMLLEGKTVEFRPSGNSMNPYIKSKQLVRLEPIEDKYSLKEWDIVLAKVNGRYLLHFIKAIKLHQDGLTFQIANASGFINGCTQNVFGIVTRTY